jgi:hypothetical protein
MVYKRSTRDDPNGRMGEPRWIIALDASGIRDVVAEFASA